MKFFFPAVFLSVVSPLLFAQNKTLDSLYQVLNDHPQEDTVRVNTLRRVCNLEYNTHPEQSKQLAEEALAISQKTGYAQGTGYAKRFIALYHWGKGDYEHAAKAAFEALKIFETCGDEKGLVLSYAMIGTVHADWGNFDQAKAYHLKALALNEKSGRKTSMAYNLNSLGVLHYHFSKHEEAADYYWRSLALRMELKDEDGMSQSYTNLAGVATVRKDYPKAIEYYTRALPVLEKSNNRYRLCTVLIGLGQVYMSTGKFAKADSLFQEALVIAQKLGNKKRIRDVYQELVAMESMRANYKKALDYSSLERLYQDSLFNQEKAKQFSEMEARYEAEKKEQAIQLLERDNKIRTLWQNILAISLIVIVLAGFFYYHIVRLSSKRNRELLNVQQVLNQKLREVDKMKSHFFASVSHEFRTPLTLILAPLEEKLAAPDQLPSEKASLRLMKRNAIRLLDLVNQLLDLSKLEAGKMKLQVSRGNASEFIRVMVASYDSWAEQKKITFLKEIPDITSETWFDADKLEKIITNLLSNAFKFTPPGGSVKLSMTPGVQPGTSLSTLIITISDTGKGIPEDELDQIFSPFYQARNSTGEGTGLGLSIMKELVRLAGGEVNLSSKVDEGSAITISLPVSRAHFAAEDIVDVPAPLRITDEPADHESRVHDQETATASISLPDAVLIIEDNDDLRNFMVSSLRGEFAVLAARDGEEGMALALQTIPNLIITDLMMPKLDGLKVTSKIKEDERTSHIPVILLTAKNEEEARLKGFRLGADEYIAKPFSVEELKIRITNLIQQRKRLAQKYKERRVVLAVTQESSIDDRFLEKVRTIAEKNLGNFLFSVEIMAEEIGLSRTQLHRKLKALTGLSTGEFIRDLRLQKAAMLLKNRSNNVAQIGYSVGFNDQSYFAKCFRKEFGMSPSEYSDIHQRQA